MFRIIISSGLMLWSLSAAFAQTFEAASIKPAAPLPQGMMMIGIRGGPGTPEPGQMTFINVSLNDLVQRAYSVKSYQVSAPDWMNSTRFDMEAKVPVGATKEQSNVMLQNLLAERFKLVVHHSTKESSIYALLVAKGGAKLKEAAKVPADDPNAPPPDTPRALGPPVIGKDGMPQLPPGARPGAVIMMAPGGRMRMMVNGATIAKFLDALATQLDRPVVDKTGLTGTYDITLEFSPDPSLMQARMAAMGGGGPPPGMGPNGPGPGGDSADAAPFATVFSALPDQLGLRLEARKGPVDLVVIDSVQKTPTEN